MVTWEVQCMGKGVVIMNNINLQKHRSLSYSQIFLNKKEIKHITSYNSVLQSKLDLMGDLIANGLLKTLRFFADYFKKNESIEDYLYELGLLHDIASEYEQTLKSGIPILNTLSNQLKKKEINEETFMLLEKIIDYQIETTKEIVTKELTIERIEVIYNHLRDVPNYLKTDLELDTLPSTEQIASEKMVNNNNWYIIKQSYDPNEKYTA